MSTQPVREDTRLHTVRIELRRRIEQDIREDGEITDSGVEHHLTTVTQQFGIRETPALRDYAYTVAGIEQPT